jgi:hypothetical protein
MHIKLTSGQPENYSIGQLRLDNPQVSFPNTIPDAALAGYEVYPLLALDQPDCNPASEKVVEGIPVKQGADWVQVWEIVSLTPEEAAQYLQNLQDSIVSQTQQRLDEFAQTRGYDGVLSLCTYASSANSKFQQEGQYGVEVRDATWAKLYEILAEVQEGTRPIPSSYADIENELPALVWPE